MGKKTVLLIGLLAVVSLLAGAVVVSAQGEEPGPSDPPPQLPMTPISCAGLAQYDLDGSGKVDGADFDTWVRRVHWGGDACKRDGPAAACPMWVDVNGDGWVSVADLDALFRFMKWCSGPPRSTWPAR